MKTIMQIQDEYAATVSAGMDRWGQHPDWGHNPRIQRGARKKARKALEAMGFTDEQIRQMIRDAHDVMMLERAAVDDELNHAI